MDDLAQLHVVSDLHLGGAERHQIFDQGKVLAAVIDDLRAREPDARIGLVLNGDIVDFLAEPNAVHLDPAGAALKLLRIFRDPAFEPVWDALYRFTATERRVLALVLGNHDVELALPDVQETLLARICGSDAARGRVRVAMDGTGYACLVGGRRVLCTHGNEVDSWNVVDGMALRNTVRALKQGGEPEAWEANGGTRLVVDVMNGIKAKYPLVDLLKPETGAVPAVLLALDPTVVGALSDLAPSLVRRGWDKLRMITKFLGEAPAMVTELPAPVDKGTALRMLVEQAMDSSAAGGKEADPRAGEDDLFKRIAAGGPGPGAGGTQGEGKLLGALDVPLRAALQAWLGGDRTFDIGTEDEVFEDLDEAVSPSVDFLVAGHTHLERALSRKHGNGVYFNSGTWIRLIRLTDKWLDDDESFAPVLKAFRAGSLDALDQLDGLVLRRNTVVSIELAGGRVEGQVGHASLAGGALRIDVQAGSQLGMEAL